MGLLNGIFWWVYGLQWDFLMGLNTHFWGWAPQRWNCRKLGINIHPAISGYLRKIAIWRYVCGKHHPENQPNWLLNESSSAGFWMTNPVFTTSTEPDTPMIARCIAQDRHRELVRLVFMIPCGISWASAILLHTFPLSWQKFHEFPRKSEILIQVKLPDGPSNFMYNLSMIIDSPH